MGIRYGEAEQTPVVFKVHTGIVRIPLRVRSLQGKGEPLPERKGKTGARVPHLVFSIPMGVRSKELLPAVARRAKSVKAIRYEILDRTGDPTKFVEPQIF
jgi:hypothetical protein